MRWKSIPIFISSTFFDMHHERDLMLPEVFRGLNEFLRSRLASVEPIDLRWGVDSSLRMDEEKEAYIVRACLEEIARSRLMVVMLGGRYGTLVNANTLSQLSCEKKVVPMVELVSITALEIACGLNSTTSIPVDVYERQVDYGTVSAMDRAGYCDLYRASVSPTKEEKGIAVAAAKALADLKRELSYRRDRYFQYEGENVPAAARNMCALLRENLEKRLDELTKDRLGFVDDEKESISAFIAHHVFNASASTRDEELQKRMLDFALTGRLNEEERDGIVLVAEPGGGKSATLCALADSLSRFENGPLVLMHFAGLDEDSSYLVLLLEKWCATLANEIPNGPSPFEESPSRSDLNLLKKRLWCLLDRVSKSRDVLLLVDGIDELERSDEGMMVSWLPARLPRGVRYIVTSGPGQETDILAERQNVVREAIPGLGEKEVLEVINSFKERTGKDMGEALRAKIQLKRSDGNNERASSNPLWLRTALDHLTLIDEAELKRAETEFAEATRDDRIARYLLKMVDDMPCDLGDQMTHLVDRAHQLMERLYDFHSSRDIMSCIAASMGGLRIYDLIAIVGRGDETFSQRFAILKLYLNTHLRYKQDGRWCLANRSVRKAIVSNLAQKGELRHVHERIADHLEERCDSDDPLRDGTLFYHLICAHRWEEAATHLIEGKNDDISVLTNIAAALLQGRRTFEYAALPDRWEIIAQNMGHSLGAEQLSGIVRLLLFPVFRQIEMRISLAHRSLYLASLKPLLEALLDVAPRNVEARYFRAVHAFREASVRLDSGEPGAVFLLKSATRSLEALLENIDTDNEEAYLDALNLFRTIAIAKSVLGDASMHNGNIDVARKEYDEAAKLLTELKRKYQEMDPIDASTALLELDLGIVETKYGDILSDLAEQEGWYGSAWTRLNQAASHPHVPFSLVGHPLARACRRLSDVWLEKYRLTGDEKARENAAALAEDAERYMTRLRELEPLNEDYKSEPRPRILV